MEPPAMRCPACQGEELCPGTPSYVLSNATFQPEGSWFNSGCTVKGFACLRCGYVGQYLPPEVLAKLRKKLGK